jgi:hypothetical protein
VEEVRIIAQLIWTKHVADTSCDGHVGGYAGANLREMGQKVRDIRHSLDVSMPKVTKPPLAGDDAL